MKRSKNSNWRSSTSIRCATLSARCARRRVSFPATITLLPFLLFLAAALLQTVGPLVALAVPAGVIVASAHLLREERVDRLFLPLAGIYAWLLVSGFLSGGLSVDALGSVEFYDTDGRVFFYYLPLLVACCVVVPFQQLARTMRMFGFFGAVILALFAVWLAGFGHSMMGEALFVAFMRHKTSAGTFFAVVAVLLLIYGMETRRSSWVWMGSLLLLPVLFAGSRQALFGVASMAVWMLFRYRSNRRLRRSVVVVGLVFVMLPLVAPASFERVSRVANVGSIEAARAQWNRPGWDPSDKLGRQLELDGGAHWNLVGRVLFYRRAWDLWTTSVVAGAGFDRYNDVLTEGCSPTGIRGLVCLRGADERVSSNISAHNSYLHILAELGVVGAFLFAALFLAVWRRLTRGEAMARAAGLPSVAAYSVGSQAVLMMLPGSALFGHALGAPQVGIPVLTVVGIGLSMCRSVPRGSEREGDRQDPVTGATGEEALPVGAEDLSGTPGQRAGARGAG